MTISRSYRGVSTHGKPVPLKTCPWSGAGPRCYVERGSSLTPCTCKLSSWTYVSPTGAFLHNPPCLASALTCPSFPPLPSLSLAASISSFLLPTSHFISWLLTPMMCFPGERILFDLSPATALMCSLFSSLPLELAPRTVMPAQGAPAGSSPAFAW